MHIRTGCHVLWQLTQCGGRRGRRVAVWLWLPRVNSGQSLSTSLYRLTVLTSDTHTLNTRSFSIRTLPARYHYLHLLRLSVCLIVRVIVGFYTLNYISSVWQPWENNRFYTGSLSRGRLHCRWRSFALRELFCVIHVNVHWKQHCTVQNGNSRPIHTTNTRTSLQQGMNTKIMKLVAQWCHTCEVVTTALVLPLELVI